MAQNTKDRRQLKHRLIKLVPITFVIIIGISIALGDIHFSPFLLCFGGCFNDRWDVHISSYKCFCCFFGYHQYNSLYVDCFLLHDQNTTTALLKFLCYAQLVSNAFYLSQVELCCLFPFFWLFEGPPSLPCRLGIQFPMFIVVLVTRRGYNLVDS